MKTGDKEIAPWIKKVAKELCGDDEQIYIKGGLQTGRGSGWVNADELAKILYAATPQVTPTRKIDGKFSTDGVRIFNTVSGEAIPDDEPLFLLRGRDQYALVAIKAYQDATKAACNELHKAGIQQVQAKFMRFVEEHPERMKQPGITKHLKLEGASEQATEKI